MPRSADGEFMAQITQFRHEQSAKVPTMIGVKNDPLCEWFSNTNGLQGRRIWLVGAGGTGVSGLARLLNKRAAMVSGGLKLLGQRLDPASLDLLWVENVGNLVCPAEFEVGEHKKVALLSVTEGDDKPLKYPVMFREADCVLITKIDLLPYLPVAVERIEDHIRQVNPRCTVIRVSASSGVGLDSWHAWLRATHAAQCPSARLATPQSLPSHPTLVNA